MVALAGYYYYYTLLLRTAWGLNNFVIHMYVIRAYILIITMRIQFLIGDDEKHVLSKWGVLCKTSPKVNPVLHQCSSISHEE